MNRKTLFSLFLINFLVISISFTGIVIGTQTPKTSSSSSSYTGLSEGDVFEFEAYVDQQGLDAFKGDLDIVKEQQKAKLGDYGDLNVSAALDKAFSNITSDEFPPEWENLNITEFFEETFKFQISELNESYADMQIPIDWYNSSYNLLNLTIDILEGIEIDNLTIYELIDVIVDETNILPSDWQSRNLSSIMIWQYGQMLNKTILSGNLPENWTELNITECLTMLIPGLKPQFVEAIMFSFYIQAMGMSPSYYTIGDVLEISYEQAYGEDFVNSTMQDMVNFTLMSLNETMGIIPSDWESMNMSWFAEEALTWLDENETYCPGILANMSTFFNFANLWINTTFNGMNETMGTVYDFTIDYMIMGWNYTFYEIDPNWNEKTLNELVDIFYSEFTESYEDFKELLSVNNTLPINFFKGFDLRFTVNNVTDELTGQVQHFNGTAIETRLHKYRYINMSIEFNIGLGYQDNGTLMLPVLDPSNFTDTTEYLQYQKLPLGYLLLSNNTDFSKITFRTMTLDLPDPCKDLSFTIDWNSNGLLKVAKIKYGSENLISIEEKAETTDAIPGFEPILLLLIGSLGVLGVIYGLRNKQRK